MAGVPFSWNLLVIFPLGCQEGLFMGRCLTRVTLQWSHYKVIQEGTRVSCWPLDAVDHHAGAERQNPLVLQEPASRFTGTRKQLPFFLQCFSSNLLTTLNTMPASREKIFQWTRSNLTEQGKKKKKERKKNEFEGSKCSSVLECLPSMWETLGLIPSPKINK